MDVGEDDLPIVDHYTYLGVEISKDCSWDANIAKVIREGKSQVGKMDTKLTDPHVDIRIKLCTVFLHDECACCHEKYGKGSS